jgi:hypothetical protein
MAHPILRARQALRSAEMQAERAESDGDIEAGPGKLADAQGDVRPDPLMLLLQL